MPYITKSVDKNYSIYYEDHGQGQPVILIHGWPLSGKSWELQVPALLEAGYRVITYDRKGFGKSQPTLDRYDYNSLTEDLLELITQLDLQNVVLVGFSMGGGEVVRFLTNYGSDNVDKVALISSIIPVVKQKDDNPDGVPQEKLDTILESVKTDRVTFLESFHKDFYNYGLLSQSVSQAQLNYDWSIASQASPIATLKSAESWANTDFRPELQNVTVPTLIVHGDDDKVVPIATAGEQAAKGIANNQYYVISGAPHGLNVTNADELNQILINFLRG
ncbi:alpha/beta fold hydrolase [Epilithonimonas sp. UC225_85]|uniref:alpha/beta fold hydrolase n=1 Tax=Epilithonimonas sp. UC225_85 TaxID=3350167 RepID=UPI0036D355D3